jgi:Asp-tRNA(Asn)/Glu-tRNA(Gln) amidotransferase A subunit family amidase
MARVKDVQLPPVVSAAFRAHATIQGYEAVRSLAYEYDRHKEQLGKSLRALLDGAMTISADAYDDARRTASQARRALADLMSEFDVILSPSRPAPAPKGSPPPAARPNRLWTLMGSPCVNVPGLADQGGLPLGMR